MKPKFQILFLLLCPLVFVFSAMAQNQQPNNRVFEVEDFSARVNDNAPTTFADLRKKIFPDFGSAEKNGVSSIPLRRIFSQNVGQTATISGVRLGKCRGIWFVSEGKRRLALLFFLQRSAPVASLDNNFYVLAAFRAESLELTDAVSVKFENFYQRTDFWGEAPLLPIREGDDAIWLTGRREDSRGDEQIDYRLLSLQDNRFAVISDELPTIKNASGAFIDREKKRAMRFEVKNRVEVFFPKSNPAYFRPFSLEIYEKLRTFRFEARSGASILEPQLPPPDYDKTFRYDAVWSEKLGRYRLSLERVSAAFSPLNEKSGDFSEILSFAGNLEIGRIYNAKIKLEKDEWKLNGKINLPASSQVEIEWYDPEKLLPKITDSNAEAQFLVVKQTDEKTLNGTWRTKLELKIIWAK